MAATIYKNGRYLDLMPYIPFIRRRVFWDRRAKTINSIYVRPTAEDYYAYYKNIIGEAMRFSNWEQGVRAVEEYRNCCLKNVQPLIVDCGGNIGMSAYWFANEFPKALVICVEPDRRNFDLAKRNLGRYANVVCVNGGISDRNGRMQVTQGRGGADGFVTKNTPDGDIDSWEIGALIEKFSGGGESALFVVKIDIEGFEGVVFSGVASWTAAPAVFIVELHDWLFPFEGTSKGIMRCVVDQNLDVILSGEHIVCFRKLG